jgi:SAM-dependent methyltransferase
VCYRLRVLTTTGPPRGASFSSVAPPGAAAASCEWCGAPFDASARRLTGRVECGRCGAQTTSPIPTDRELEDAYGGWYRPDAGRFSGPGDRLLARMRGAFATRLDRIAPPGPVLDVGAGDGRLLDALGARGRRATGLERRSTRPDVREQEIGDVEPGWAAIVFWHSLEHLRGAGGAVARAAELLRPGGVLVVAMPNPASIQARAFGDRWLALDLPRHLVHVPEPALRSRLEGLGLTVERTSGLRGGQVTFGWMHGLVGSLPGRPDLYDAIRRPDARRMPMSGSRRAATLAAGALVSPVAAALALGEAAAGRSGTSYVEARRDG